MVELLLGPESDCGPALMQSWAGSLACVVGGFCAICLFLFYFSLLGCLHGLESVPHVGFKVLAVAFVGGFVESLAIETWDNVTVSLSVAFASSILLQS